MNPIQPKRILICPLDWGLGHATRCIPIINELKKRSCEVSIATSGEALTLLKREFPLLEFHEIVSYRAEYSLRLTFMIKIFIQLPKFSKAIHREHSEVTRIIKERKIDCVISDCRYGCWSDQVSSIFITHQINLLMPPFLKWMGPLINYFNHRQIKKFTNCWVPDFPESRITGNLSASRGLVISYIGMLSRFNSPTVIGRPKKYEIVAILSGPEPQRLRFEEILKSQLLLFGKSCLLVRGLPSDEVRREIRGQLQIVNYLPAAELQVAIEESGVIISRSGYSSIMDFARVGGRVIFVPTPGQTEQQYLAEQLKMKGIAFYQKQEEFNLSFGLTEAAQYTGFKAEDFSSNLLNKAIDDL